MKHLKNAELKLRKTAYAITFTGVLNFLLGDLFGYNPVDETFGKDSSVTLLIYGVIGIATMYVFYDLVRSLRKDQN